MAKLENRTINKVLKKLLCSGQNVWKMVSNVLPRNRKIRTPTRKNQNVCLTIPPSISPVALDRRRHPTAVVGRWSPWIPSQGYGHRSSALARPAGAPVDGEAPPPPAAEGGRRRFNTNLQMSGETAKLRFLKLPPRLLKSGVNFRN